MNIFNPNQDEAVEFLTRVFGPPWKVKAKIERLFGKGIVARIDKWAQEGSTTRTYHVYNDRGEFVCVYETDLDNKRII